MSDSTSMHCKCHLFWLAFVVPNFMAHENGDKKGQSSDGTYDFQRCHQQCGIQKPFLNLKERLKIGTEKTVLVNYAESLFQTWAIYNDCC